ncbi:hypothetical protein TNCV_3450371 [Trichonephila clavipes]|uniref:Uncharacterized protein n=1 Tax=Trichonephila clavipes TaxID=2585209 RepID=A0A8X7BN84_TRICX|nr:hypothetical protein TNCV_3450371 [Trichonephila clavipes]
MLTSFLPHWPPQTFHISLIQASLPYRAVWMHLVVKLFMMYRLTNPSPSNHHALRKIVSLLKLFPLEASWYSLKFYVSIETRQNLYDDFPQATELA